jgi:hypothetical protein
MYAELKFEMSFHLILIIEGSKNFVQIVYSSLTFNLLICYLVLVVQMMHLSAIHDLQSHYDLILVKTIYLGTLKVCSLIHQGQRTVFECRPLAICIREYILV